MLLLFRTTLERQTPVEIMYDGFIAATKLAIVILSFVACGILCELLVFILRLGKIRLIMENEKEGRARVQ